MADDFLKELEKIVKRIKNDTDEIARGITEEIFTTVVGRTPIDADRREPDSVGLARANWIPTQDKFNKTVTSDLDEADGPAPVFNPSGPTVQRIKAFMENVDVTKDPRLYLTNNIDYIKKLEYMAGYSKQAPAGMRAITLAETEQIARRVINKKLTGR